MPRHSAQTVLFGNYPHRMFLLIERYVTLANVDSESVIANGPGYLPHAAACSPMSSLHGTVSARPTSAGTLVAPDITSSRTICCGGRPMFEEPPGG